MFTKKIVISIFLTGIVSICFFENFVFAQSKNQLSTKQLLGQINTITTGVPFLLITPDSRNGAMGDAGVASSPTANSMHWNPSLYGFVEKTSGISIAYTPWLKALVPDISLTYLSGYYKLQKKGTLAASLRYFSMGNITFTDNRGEVLRQFEPKEFAIDAGYGIKLSDNFAGGGAIRFINSNLTGGTPVEGSQTRAGISVASDISGTYQSDEKEIKGKKTIIRSGINISNIGAKISYSDRGEKSFIPINMRIGSSMDVKLDDYNDISFAFDINKLLVPTIPIYQLDSTGYPDKDINTGDYIILKGKDPNRSVVNGILGSFNDAPGGFREELREFTLGGGFEYWYAKQFALRAGYFHEHKTKGNRKYITFGIGVKYSVFGLDFSYLVPLEQQHPLQNTLRFTLLFDLNAFKEQDLPAENNKISK
ncbi:MAG: type IX secretion system outer membrane channel protein PorV [Bacteroidota bacterium]